LFLCDDGFVIVFFGIHFFISMRIHIPHACRRKRMWRSCIFMTQKCQEKEGG
jgi:hypothetical protein